MTALLLAAAFALIVAGAVLFTSAVEWAGRRLDLGQGAAGSVLAAVGTAALRFRNRRSSGAQPRQLPKPAPIAKPPPIAATPSTTQAT